MRIAIVRLTSLGDIIFCMAALQFIKRHLPESSITWFADAKFADILDHNPDLDAVVKVKLKGLKKNLSLEKVRGEYRRVVEAGKFDVAIDLHGMLKSAVIARKAGEVRCGFHRTVAKEPLATFLYDRTFAPPMSITPVARYTTLAAQSLGIPFAEEELLKKSPYLFHGAGDAEASAGFFQGEGKNVLLVPGTSLGLKNYPADRFTAICNRLQAKILICHGGDQELETARYIEKRCPSARILPRLNLNQLKAAVSRADLVIGGDTGPTHIAWANNVPVIALFGPTPVCTYPSEISRIVVPPRGIGRPMQEIEEETIVRHAEELLQQQTRTQ